ncbi:hypothetical protein ACHAXM_010925 [Skeletonema potamos]
MMRPLLLLLPLMLIPRSFQFSIQRNHIIWFTSSSSSSGRHRLVPTSRWALPQFQVGDAVIVNDVDGTDQFGRVHDKKSGWYTIRLDRDSTLIKRRGSQMEYNSDSDATVTSITNAIAPKINRQWKGEMDLPAQPTILDLDSILQSIKHQTSDAVDINSIIHNTSPNATIAEETIQQITNCHSHYTKWLIFSDLHVMPSTLKTCLQVLDTIHTAALERQAGIIFLGDFWHHRGFVRVDCLNSVLGAMSNWKVPCIMIPGNHDQIDWRGVEHALTPLNNAYRIHSPVLQNNIQRDKQQYYAGPLILSHPTKFLDAFFIPHIRDKAVMKSILSSQAVAQSSALFVHADVKGASMNDLIKSRNGLSAIFFPAEKQIYSGHFHKPHVVITASSSDRSKIRYVGSPYQISSSEEGQSKSLLLVDSQNCWECIEEIPLDIGPRFHRVTSVNEFLAVSEENHGCGDGVNKKLRRGDKVIVAVPQSDIDALNTAANSNINSFDERVKICRENGISVEIRDSQATSAKTPHPTSSNENDNNIEVDLEELSASATLVAYLRNEVADGKIDGGTAKELAEKGEAILRELNDIASNSTAPMNDAPNTIQMTDLDLESVSIRGFGLFREESTYPLRKRGVVLIRGRNDDFGSDSNGVGKTTIAMASLWALSGSLDPRPTQDGKVGDVVNDLSKVAEVTLRGSLNSKPFVVKRTKSKSSAGSLSFILGGNDLTRQSATDTQKLINEHFCSDSQLLMRTIFHGQHSIGGLLEASDAKLKDELSQLVSLDIWQHAASLARSKQREQLRKTTEIDGMISLREKDEKVAHEKSLLAKLENERRRTILEEARISFVEKEKEVLNSSLSASLIEKEMDVLQSLMRQSDTELSDLDEELSAIMESHNHELTRLRSVLKDKVTIESEAKAKLWSSQRMFDKVLIEQQTAEENLLRCQSDLEELSEPQNVSQDAKCHTCGQPIVTVEAREHVLQSYEEKLNIALSTKIEADNTMTRESLKRDQTQAAADAATLEVIKCLEDISRAEAIGSLNTNGLRERIHKIRSMQSERSVHFASLVKKSKHTSNFDLEKARIDADLIRLVEALDASTLACDICRRDLERVQRNISDLKKERDERSRDAAATATLVNVLGAKGIQAFVLQNIVDALEVCSRPYLDVLSEGSLQLHIQVGSNDSIIKQAAIRNPDGTWCSRPLASLSGGQWRRLSLSLSLGFVQLSSKRGNLRSSLLIMDEPLAHLDSTGRASVGKLLRKMCNEDTLGLSISTILVILQDIAAEEIEECFDQVDEVVKSGGESYVILDANMEDVEVSSPHNVDEYEFRQS